jgi:hypothetical protein
MRTILLALGLALLAGPADAQQRPALRFDPNRIEFATPWAQSSPCLGDTRDPICLAQTVVVCWILHGRPECAGGLYAKHFNPQNHDRIEYRIVRAGIVPLARLEEMQESLFGSLDVDRAPMAARHAVIAQIVIRQNTCPAGEASCEGFLATDNLIIVERKRRGWTLQWGRDFRRYDWYAD